MKFYYSVHKDCHCEERSGRAAINRDEGRAYSAVRFLKNIESPQTYGPRDDIDERFVITN